mgnify:CR=1 FL=1
MLDLRVICKRYVTQSFTQVALDSVSLSFRDNEFVAILGPSGSGKTTMLNVIGGLDHFDSGDLLIDGISTKDFSDRDWDAYRNNRIGFVFQSYNLIPHQSILENVELALTLTGVGHAERRQRARKALETVGLGEHVDKRPNQLSGGQMQRVAIARALINDPEIVLADEPTGALDSTTSVQVMDLLKDVARDRLVIMVTHNPELAYQYATRIVSLADGKVTDDSDPFDVATVAHREAKPTRKTSMSFMTALGLSARNLMTKKGRTAMTAFAGSIGIIGIAAILALSNGVNGYIKKVEEDTLSSYPLTISKQDYDLSSMMGGQGGTDEEASKGEDSSDGATGGKAQGTDKIPVVTAVKDMFASVKSNDMTSFKAWLDDGGNGIDKEVNAIQYGYGVTPVVYRSSKGDEKPVRLVPNAMTEAMSGGASSAATVSMDSMGTSVFNEMIDDQSLLDSQYDVVAGHWPTSANEAVMVLSSRGTVGDYTLYSIGALDIDELNDLVNSAMTADGKVKTPKTGSDFTYDDALSTTFKVLSPADAYRKNEETGMWTDMSGDADFMKTKVADGIDVRIVGVVRPNETANASALSPGIVYTHALTRQLMERAADSQIVQEQLAHPETDVFTGKTFDELQGEAKQGVDLGSMFSVDEAALKSAFSFDASALSGAAGGMDLSGLDLSGLDIDLSGVGRDIDFSDIMAKAPAPDFSGIFDGLELTPEQMQQVGALANQLFEGFMRSDQFKALSPEDLKDASKLAAAFSAYLENDVAAQQYLAQLRALGGDALAERLQQVMGDYVQKQLAPYLQQSMDQVMKAVSEQIATTVSTQLKAGAAAHGPNGDADVFEFCQPGERHARGCGRLCSCHPLQHGRRGPELAHDELCQASKLTYDNNLTTLGYADEADPISVKIFPRDFEAKERVLDHIDAYNKQVKAAGHDEQAISYTDYMGIIMGSVTDIVNTISLVLIAFVSISLVVSSIMIGIITYISVLERKKEIGILRAIGASKRNVANVFNAETFIEGLIAGVFAIVVVVAVSFPVNAWALAAKQVPNLMSLPVQDALMLIAISVLLTVVAGLLPARSASKKDPVEALRSE